MIKKPTLDTATIEKLCQFLGLPSEMSDAQKTIIILSILQRAMSDVIDECERSKRRPTEQMFKAAIASWKPFRRLCD